MKRVKKYADGGNVGDVSGHMETMPYIPNDIPNGTDGPLAPPGGPTSPSPGRTGSGFGGGSAFNGLEQIRSGADAAEQALQQASQSIGSSDKNGGSGGLGGLRRLLSGGYKKGGMVGNASKRGDGIAQRGKTKGRFV